MSEGYKGKLRLGMILKMKDQCGEFLGKVTDIDVTDTYAEVDRTNDNDLNIKSLKNPSYKGWGIDRKDDGTWGGNDEYGFSVPLSWQEIFGKK